MNLNFLFVHDHSTKVRDHSYSLIYSFLNCADVLFAIFKAVLPLYFVRSISGSIAFIFRPLYSQQYYPYISYTIFVELLLLYFARYIQSYMKSQPDFVLKRDPKNIFYYQCGVKNYTDHVLNFLLFDRHEYIHSETCALKF